MVYDCITCGPLELDVHDLHDGRNGTHCLGDCIPIGECDHPDEPAVRRNGAICYWAGLNGHTDGWYAPDPAHVERTEEDFYKTLPGQLDFDRNVFTRKEPNAAS